MEDNFYITLPSNASLQYAPDNTASSFTVTLPQPIHLDGDWVCGLAEIHFPNNLSALIEGTLIVSGFSHTSLANSDLTPLTDTFPYNSRGIQQGYVVETKRPTTGELSTKTINKSKIFSQPISELNTQQKFSFVHSVSTANQTSVIATEESFLEMLNTTLQKSPQLEKRKMIKNPEMVYPIEIRKMEPTGFEIVIRDNDLILTLSPNILRLLGYGVHDKLFMNFKGKGRFLYPYQKIDLEADKPRSFHVYSGIIAPQFVGDARVPSLRCVSIPIKTTLSSNEIVSTTFNEIQYVPVNNKTFSQIETQLRDNVGRKLAFTFGQTIVVLHLKKRS